MLGFPILKGTRPMMFQLSGFCFIVSIVVPFGGLRYRILHMCSCQNYGPFWGTLNIRCRIIIRTQKGTIILPTTHIRLVKPKKDLQWRL